MNKPDHCHLDGEFARIRLRLQAPGGHDEHGDPTCELQRDMFDMLLRSLRSEVLPRPRRTHLRAMNWLEARAFVDRHHSHHDAPQGWKFGCGLEDELGLIGVVIVGRPVSRKLDDGRTLEVTRLCTLARAQNAASTLLGAACRAAKSLGYSRMVTYTLSAEEGTSCKAAGFLRAAEVRGGHWSRRSRKRADRHPLEAKTRWERRL